MPDDRRPTTIYIHFPFCRKRCAYCDFHSSEGREREIENYVARLIDEVAAKRDLVAPGVPSLYVGGGTPSLMTEEQIGRLLEACRESFNFAEDAEITLEVNPESGAREKLRAAAAAGVNRLSIGVQSFSPSVLETLGRIHTVADAERTFRDARESGFRNCSLDLIFGSPGESMIEWETTLGRAMELRPEHISAYSLTIESQTTLAQRIEKGDLPAVDEDLSADKYERTIRMLTDAGFVHYEISSFRLPGRESRHNLHYWANGDYLGLGCGAHSHLRGERFRNVESLEDYLGGQDGFRKRFDLAEETPEIGATEDLLLGLRRIREGVDLEALADRRGEAQRRKIEGKLAPFLAQNLLTQEGRRLRLTKKGILFADEILASLI